MSDALTFQFEIQAQRQLTKDIHASSALRVDYVSLLDEAEAAFGPAPEKDILKLKGKAERDGVLLLLANPGILIVSIRNVPF